MKKIRAGIVGAGFIGRAHVEALRRLGGVEVAALADVEQAQEKARAWNIPLAFRDAERMMEEAGLEVIHICTPNSTHCGIALSALDRGLHVICEKPFCRTLREADEMAEAARRSGSVCAVNYHNRFYPMAYEMRQKVTGGELGRVFSVHGEYLQDWLLYDTDFSWRILPEKGGKTRAYGDIGSHWVDLAEFVLGQRVTEVFAATKICHPVRKAPVGKAAETFRRGAEADLAEFPVETEDICLLLLRFSGGALGSLVVSQTFAGCKNGLSLRVAGAESSLSWDLEGNPNLLLQGFRDGPNRLVSKARELVTDSTAALIAYPGGHAEGFPDALKQHFGRIYRQIADPSLPVDFADFAQGRHLVGIGEKIFASARENSWMAVD